MAQNNTGERADITQTLGLDAGTTRKRHWQRWLGWTILVLAIAAGALWGISCCGRLKIDQYLRFVPTQN